MTTYKIQNITINYGQYAVILEEPSPFGSAKREVTLWSQRKNKTTNKMEVNLESIEKTQKALQEFLDPAIIFTDPSQAQAYQNDPNHIVSWVMSHIGQEVTNVYKYNDRYYFGQALTTSATSVDLPQRLVSSTPNDYVDGVNFVKFLDGMPQNLLEQITALTGPNVSSNPKGDYRHLNYQILLEKVAVNQTSNYQYRNELQLLNRQELLETIIESLTEAGDQLLIPQLSALTETFSFGQLLLILGGRSLKNVRDNTTGNPKMMRRAFLEIEDLFKKLSTVAIQGYGKVVGGQYTIRTSPFKVPALDWQVRDSLYLESVNNDFGREDLVEFFKQTGLDLNQDVADVLKEKNLFEKVSKQTTFTNVEVSEIMNAILEGRTVNARTNLVTKNSKVDPQFFAPSISSIDLSKPRQTIVKPKQETVTVDVTNLPDMITNATVQEVPTQVVSQPVQQVPTQPVQQPVQQVQQAPTQPVQDVQQVFQNAPVAQAMPQQASAQPVTQVAQPVTETAQTQAYQTGANPFESANPFVVGGQNLGDAMVQSDDLPF